MSDGSTPTPSSSPPNPWVPTLLGSTASCVVLFCAAYLALQFYSTRPVDLRAATLEAAATIETGLLSNRVPERNIRAVEEFRTSEFAEYYHFEYDVAVPVAIDAQRLRNALRQQLQKLGVSAAATQGAQGEPTLELTLAGLPFGFVRLAPQSIDPWREWPALGSGSDAGPEAPAPQSTDDAASAESGEPTVRDEKPVSLESRVGSQTPDMPEPPDATDSSNVETIEGASTTPAPGLEADPGQPSQPAQEWTPPVQIAKIPADSPAPAVSPGNMRVAIIVDDGGYGGDVTERILALDRGLTLSILPYTPFGAETARRARELGFEVMLHMPMENMDSELRHEGQLEVGMSAATIGALTLKALDEIPGAAGVNNHMGSKFTADPLYMGFFADAIKGQELYFVDSRTTAESSAYDAAVSAGISAGYRHIFLDHDNTPETIESQFRSMMTMAEEKGAVIAIAHFRPNTVETLERLLPELASAGIELVHASELMP